MNLIHPFDFSNTIHQILSSDIVHDQFERNGKPLEMISALADVREIWDVRVGNSEEDLGRSWCVEWA